MTSSGIRTAADCSLQIFTNVEYYLRDDNLSRRDTNSCLLFDTIQLDLQPVTPKQCHSLGDIASYLGYHLLSWGIDIAVQFRFILYGGH